MELTICSVHLTRQPIPGINPLPPSNWDLRQLEPSVQLEGHSQVHERAAGCPIGQGLNSMRQKATGGAQQTQVSTRLVVDWIRICHRNTPQP